MRVLVKEKLLLRWTRTRGIGRRSVSCSGAAVAIHWLAAWDTDDIDQYASAYIASEWYWFCSWKIEPFLQPDKSKHQPFTEESSFALLFPKYREPYLRSVWGQITSSLETVGLACELDLVSGKMTVKTTRKTWDPYVVLKGRDVLKLLARGVNAPQVSTLPLFRRVLISRQSRYFKMISLVMSSRLELWSETRRDSSNVVNV